MEWKLSPKATILSAIGAWILTFSLERTGMITSNIAIFIAILSLILFIPAGAELFGWKRKQNSKPLEIIFDLANPANRFWSMEAPASGGGETMPHWEYRVEIKNNSVKTIRNVTVTVEHIGQCQVRPVIPSFDMSENRSCDINPGDSRLVRVVHWPIPVRQPGFLSGPSAIEYGPVVVTASGDDILPTTRKFQFDYQRTPMIFD